MKFPQLLLAVLLIGLCSQTALAQRNKKNKDTASDVTVFESVLKTAEWANFKYVEELSRAKSGDYESTFKLLKFSGAVDGKAALDHSVTLLELLSGRDASFAAPLSKSSDKLKEVLLDRLQLAQGRTTKEDLRKPIAEWAPATWDVLHGKSFTIEMQQGDMKTIDQLKSAPAKPGTTQAGKASDLQGIMPRNEKKGNQNDN